MRSTWLLKRKIISQGVDILLVIVVHCLLFPKIRLKFTCLIKQWYMLTGPADNDNLSRYHVSRIYRSKDPLKFGKHYQALTDNKRIFVDGNARPFRDVDGKWYITTTNDMSGGVWIAPLYWNDGLGNDDSSIQPAGK